MNASLSHAAEQAAKRIELDLTRRLFLGGLAGSLSIFSKSSLPEQLSKERPTTVSPEGIIRTVIENYANDLTGEEFKLVMTSYPPGVGLPSHHHPSAALNYMLEGVAESRYATEELQFFKAGESYRDKAGIQHEIFRNPDRDAHLKYLIAYTVRKGQPYLIVP